MLKKHYSSAKHISIDYTPFPRGGSVSDLTNIQESGISVVKDIPGRLEVLADTSSISVSHVISILNSRLEINDLSRDQVLLCFSVVLSAFSIAELFAAGFKGFSHVVSNGEFDRIMLRPAGTLFQTFASRIEFSSVGRLLQAAIILLPVLEGWGE